MCRYRDGCLKPVLAPVGEVLSATKTIHGFRPSGQPLAVQIRSWRICASPKESIQRKGGPDAAYSLRSSLSTGIDRRGFLPLYRRAAFMLHPCGLLTRYVLVPRSSGATHANRLSCRFVSTKAPVLGAAYGRKNRPSFGSLSASAQYHLNLNYRGD